MFTTVSLRSGVSRSVRSARYANIVLPPLPYDKAALEPHISRETLDYHYGKHHQGYVTKLNAQLKSDETDLPTLIRTLDGPNFNLAAQIYNHTFYWESMSPSGGGEPVGRVADLINSTWGSFAEFKSAFNATGASLFGSGWVWLVKDSKTGALKIVPTANADCPIRTGDVPILTCDVWEHAYYIDYRHDRALYLSTWWNLVNWEFANKNLA